MKTRNLEDPCNQAPEGWICTRQAYHNGPCAAVPIQEYYRELENRLKVYESFSLEYLNFIKDPKSGDQSLDLKLKNPFVFIFTDAMVNMLKDNNAINFFTMELYHPTEGRIEVTIQRLAGKSTSQMLSELKAEIEELKK